MEIICDNCGYPFSSTDSDDSRTEWRCPICGSPAHRSDQVVESGEQIGRAHV